MAPILSHFLELTICTSIILALIKPFVISLSVTVPLFILPFKVKFQIEWPVVLKLNILEIVFYSLSLCYQRLDYVHYKFCRTKSFVDNWTYVIKLCSLTVWLLFLNFVSWYFHFVYSAAIFASMCPIVRGCDQYSRCMAFFCFKLKKRSNKMPKNKANIYSINYLKYCCCNNF